MNVDVRKELEAAERRFSELMLEYDELQDANRRRCEELVMKVAAGEALEEELLSAQTIAESRENIQRSAIINYEEQVVRPLCRKVRKLEISEGLAEVRRLDKEAAEARERLEDFLNEAGEREAGLRGHVNELEEESARVQHKIRAMRAEPVA